MTQNSSRLSLPYLQPSQAQKHVTHNEALERLDMLVQLSVEAFEATVPPTAPESGQVWAIGSNAVGDWAGHDGDLAGWSNGGWLFITPLEGWRAAMGTEVRVRTGGAWQAHGGIDFENLVGVGVNATFDVVNKLSVAADATLLSHDGQDTSSS